MVEISRTQFPKGITECTVTFDEGNPCYIGTDTAGIRFSLDGTVFQQSLTLSVGTTTIYVRINSTVQDGIVQDGIQWSYLDTDHYVEGSWDITVGTVEPNHYAPLQMQLSQRSSTIRYNATLLKGTANLGSNLSGNILDYNYNFRVERIQEQGTRKAISGSAYADKLVNKLIIYEVEYKFRVPQLAIERPTFRDHLDSISDEIGMDIIYQGLDFYPKTNINVALRKNPFSLNFFEVLTGDFATILSNLIGFTADLPNMVIDLFIKEGKIYLIQRGYETNTYTPAHWLQEPSLSYSIRHTQWGDSSTQQVVPKEIRSSDAVDNSQPYSGVISWGSGQFLTQMTYDEGYLVSQVTGNTTTTYTYIDIDGSKYLSSKTAVTTDEDTQETVSTATNTYSYETSNNELYLHTDEYTVTDADNEITEHRLTRYTPTQPGWYGVDTFDLIENEQIGSNLTNGAPGQKANQYLIDKFNNSIKPSGSSQQPISVAITGVAKAAQQYPIANRDSFSGGFGLQQVADSLDYYEGKTECVLSGTIVDDTHLYNYDDKIIYNGNEYFLVSNNITYSGTNGVRQDITAVRYY